MDMTVKYFTSTMANAPTLSGTTGSLTSVLDACLVTGFGSVTLDSLVVASNIATGTVSAGHGLTMTRTIGPVMTIAGATPSNLNGEWRIASVPSSTTFTFATTGISDQTATGTITAKRAPMGWTKAFSGTNKAAYLPYSDYAQCCLRVQDDSSVPNSSNGRFAVVRGYESMTDVDTGTGLFPLAATSANGLMIWKSNASDSSSRPWWLIGDQGIIYIGIGANGSQPTLFGTYCFGDIGSLKAGDAYNSLLCATHPDLVSAPSSYGSYFTFGELISFGGVQDGKYLARSYTQIGNAVTAGFMGDNSVSSMIGVSGIPYPHFIDNSLLISSIAVVESTVIRSLRIPGLYQPLHAVPLQMFASVDNIPEIPGRTLMACPVVSRHPTNYSVQQGQCLIDITGPWR